MSTTGNTSTAFSPTETPLVRESSAPPYEQRMATNWSEAMSESSLFFEGRGRVQDTLRRVTARLDKLEINYAIAGGMCLFRHGFRRYTEDVDLLVTRENLVLIHDNLEGLGYVRLFQGSKGLRDATTGVKIDFLITGDYPGDGKPKEISFPYPESVSVELDGVKYLNLPTLIMLKLASGLSSSNRTKDIADVQELIKALNLGISIGESLPVSLQADFRRIYRETVGEQKFLRRWAEKTISDGPITLDTLISQEPSAAAMIRAMWSDGVRVLTDDERLSDAIYLFTHDPQIAAKYDMHPESEFFF